MLADIEPYQLNSTFYVRRVIISVQLSKIQINSFYEVTNEMRKLKGLKPLKINSDLAHIASNNLYEATSNGSDSAGTLQRTH